MAVLAAAGGLALSLGLQEPARAEVGEPSKVPNQLDIRSKGRRSGVGNA